MKRVTLLTLALMTPTILKPMDQNFLNQQAKLYVEHSLKTSQYSDIKEFLKRRLEKSQSSLKIEKDYEVLMAEKGDYCDDNYSKVFAGQITCLCTYFTYNTCLKKYPENSEFKKNCEQAKKLSSLEFLEDKKEFIKMALICLRGYSPTAAEELMAGGFLSNCWCLYEMVLMYFSFNSSSEDPYDNLIKSIMEESYGKNYVEEQTLNLIKKFSEACLDELELKSKILDEE